MYIEKVCWLPSWFWKKKKKPAQTTPSRVWASPPPVSPLTPNGEDHDNEVKHIPAVGEVMPQGEQLHDILAREDSHKELIDFVKDFCLFFTLLISLHHHGDHVEADEDHDDNVKSLSDHNVKDKALVLVLRKQEMVHQGLSGQHTRGIWRGCLLHRWLSKIWLLSSSHHIQTEAKSCPYSFQNLILRWSSFNASIQVLVAFPTPLKSPGTFSSLVHHLQALPIPSLGYLNPNSPEWSIFLKLHSFQGALLNHLITSHHIAYFLSLPTAFVVSLEF